MLNYPNAYGTPDAMTTFDTPDGVNNFAEPASTYTNCVIHLSAVEWPIDWRAQGDAIDPRIDNWPRFCRVIVHEFGHLLGYPDEFTEPHGIEYIESLEENIPAICRVPLRARPNK
jgi:hypothetical protein